MKLPSKPSRSCTADLRHTNSGLSMELSKHESHRSQAPGDPEKRLSLHPLDGSAHLVTDTRRAGVRSAAFARIRGLLQQAVQIAQDQLGVAGIQFAQLPLRCFRESQGPGQARSPPHQGWWCARPAQRRRQRRRAAGGAAPAGGKGMKQRGSLSLRAGCCSNPQASVP